MPTDWLDGYNNVIIALSIENEESAREKIPIFLNLPIKHRKIFLSPLLEYVDLKPFLKSGLIEEVSISGESYQNARLCDFSWVKKIYIDCLKYHVAFDFHQTGSNFKKDNKIYHIKHSEEYEQAKKGEKWLKDNISFFEE